MVPHIYLLLVVSYATMKDPTARIGTDTAVVKSPSGDAPSDDPVLEGIVKHLRNGFGLLDPDGVDALPI
jgi:hypothetical protein